MLDRWLRGRDLDSTGPLRTKPWKVSPRRASAGARVPQPLLLPVHLSCPAPRTQHCQHHPPPHPARTHAPASTAPPLLASPLPSAERSRDRLGLRVPKGATLFQRFQTLNQSLLDKYRGLQTKNSSDLERGPGPRSIADEFSVSNPLVIGLQRCENTAFHFHAAPFGTRSPRPVLQVRDSAAGLRDWHSLL